MRLGFRKQSPDIPTSSMADIAFLLIVFFMVTSVFSVTKGLDAKLPGETPNDAQPEDAVLIHVYPDRIMVDCKPMGLDQILPYLQPKLLRAPDKPVILYIDGDTAYGDMVAVLDVLAATRKADSAWPFVVKNISIPTRGEIERYVEMFGVNPMEAACSH